MNVQVKNPVEVNQEVSMYNVYVIELDKVVKDSPGFRAVNPDYNPEKPCVYVGMTATTPKVRFKQHKDGYKANRYARDHGKFLRWNLFKKYNPMTRDEAQRCEVKLADDLRRKRGYAVWQK